jgi:hypothetical protein
MSSAFSCAAARANEKNRNANKINTNNNDFALIIIAPKNFPTDGLRPTDEKKKALSVGLNLSGGNKKCRILF